MAKPSNNIAIKLPLILTTQLRSGNSHFTDEKNKAQGPVPPQIPPTSIFVLMEYCLHIQQPLRGRSMDSKAHQAHFFVHC
jgi:hypothetical protein